MRILSPLFFWSFVSLLPLVAVYFLKVRPRRAPTTAFFLWQQVFQEKRATSLFRRLRDFWSLLLMGLAFCAVCLALTNPQWTSDERKDLLIVIDNSASMNARAGSESCLDKARDAARDVVRAMDGAQRAALASLGDRLVYHSHMTDSPRQLLEAIEAVQPAVGGRDNSAIPRVEPGESWSDTYRIVLISDGDFAADTMPGKLDWINVGSQRDNAGLVAADMQYLSFPERQLALFVQLASSFDTPREADLSISYARNDEPTQLVKVIPFQIQPGVNRAQTLIIDRAEPGRWTVQLDIADALDLDNVAYLAVEAPRPVRVAVESDDRYFFENSVIAFSRGAGLLTLDPRDPQVVVSKSTTPDADFALIFQPEGSSRWWLQTGEELPAVIPRLLVHDHPALRFTDPEAISYVGAKELQAPENAQVWVASDQGVPLIYQASQEGKTAIVVNMDPAAAEFYFSAWFPVMVHSAATHLAGREAPRMSTHRPADAVNIPGVQENEQTQFTDPAGSVRRIVGKTTPPLDQLGFYALANASGDWLVACSLLSTTETLAGNEEPQPSTTAVRRGRSPAHWLTVLAIMLLTVESLLYHRRKVG